MEKGRRTHRKSKNGCDQCKARKVKCDETKPSCNNCLRHGVSCVYADAPLPRSPAAASLSSSSMGTTSVSGQQTLTKMVELELLHHYTTCTCYTISRHPVLQTIWRVKVPQLGFTSSFVMNTILALSALHLANFKPDQKEFYISQGILLYDVALREVSSILPNVTQHNCAGLYVFSILTSVISCAKPREGIDFLLVGDNGISEWLFTFRGVRSVLESAGDLMLSGPISPIYSAGLRKIQLRKSVPITQHPYLFDLYRLVTDETAAEPKTLQVYMSALDEMSKSYEAIFDPDARGFESSDVFFWLFLVSDDYLKLLAENKSVALIIFAHFCVLTKQMEWTWWMKGWSAHLLSSIHSSLGHEYQPWLQWPMEQIGWLPGGV